MAQDPNWDDIFGSAPGQDPQAAQNASAPSHDSIAPDAPATGAAEADSRRARREQERGSPEPTRASARRSAGPERKKPRRNLIWLWILLAVLAIGATGASWAWANYEEQIRVVMGWEIPPEDYVGTGTEETTITIQDGDNGSDIAQTLLDAGVTKSFDAFYDLLLAQDPPSQFFPGNYLLAKQMSAEAALDALLDPESRLMQTALIQEGKSISQVFEILSAATQIPVADFEAAAEDHASFGVPPEAPSLEGYLFPATYNFDGGLDARTVIQTLVNRMFQSLDAAGVPAADRHRILTIASLIQREAGSLEEDFYKVSRVIQNRLDQGMLLQFDSTAHYGYIITYGEREAGSVFSSSDELGDGNAYNTYVHTGLPIGPIGAPGDLAIKAALAPAEGPWLYFVTVNLETGETAFTNTNAEHNAAVEQLRSWCRQTQSPNCD